MTTSVQQDVQATIQAWDTAAWSLAALALAAREDCPPELAVAARELLAAAGLTGASGPLPGPGTSGPGQAAAQASAALDQAADPGGDAGGSACASRTSPVSPTTAVGSTWHGCLRRSSPSRPCTPGCPGSQRRCAPAVG